MPDKNIHINENELNNLLLKYVVTEADKDLTVEKSIDKSAEFVFSKPSIIKVSSDKEKELIKTLQNKLAPKKWYNNFWFNTSIVFSILSIISLIYLLNTKNSTTINTKSNSTIIEKKDSSVSKQTKVEVSNNNLKTSSKTNDIAINNNEVKINKEALIDTKIINSNEKIISENKESKTADSSSGSIAITNKPQSKIISDNSTKVLGVRLQSPENARIENNLRDDRNLKFTNNNYGCIMQCIDINDYRGKEIMLSAYVKVDKSEQNEGAHLFLRAENQQRVCVNEYMKNEPIKVNNKWEKYSIKAVITNDAINLVFGCFLQNTGKIFIDKFELFYKENNEWKKIPIYDFSFEKAPKLFDDNKFKLKYAWTFYSDKEKFNVGFNSTKAIDGSSCVMIERP